MVRADCRSAGAGRDKRRIDACRRVVNGLVLERPTPAGDKYDRRVGGAGTAPRHEHRW